MYLDILSRGTRGHGHCVGVSSIGHGGHTSELIHSGGGLFVNIGLGFDLSVDIRLGGDVLMDIGLGLNLVVDISLGGDIMGLNRLIVDIGLRSDLFMNIGNSLNHLILLGGGGADGESEDAQRQLEDTKINSNSDAGVLVIFTNSFMMSGYLLLCEKREMKMRFYINVGRRCCHPPELAVFRLGTSFNRKLDHHKHVSISGTSALT